MMHLKIHAEHKGIDFRIIYFLKMPSQIVKNDQTTTNQAEKKPYTPIIKSRKYIKPDLLDDAVDLFSSDCNDDFIALSNSNGIVEIFQNNGTDFNQIFHLAHAEGRGQSIMSCRFIGDNRIVTGDTGGNLCMYNLEDINRLREAELSELSVGNSRNNKNQSQNQGKTSQRNFKVGNAPNRVIDEFDKELEIDNQIPHTGILPNRRLNLIRNSSRAGSITSFSGNMDSRRGSSFSLNSSSASSQKCGITSIDWNKRNLLAAVSMDRTIRLYDSRNLCRTAISKRDIDISDESTSVLEGHSKTPHCVKFIDNDLFVTSGWDDCLKLWDVRAPSVAALSINGTHVCGPSIDVQPGSNNKVLCVGNWRSQAGLQLWDLRKAGNSTTDNLTKGVPENLLANGANNTYFDLKTNKTRELPNNGHFIYAVKFLNNEIVLAGGSSPTGTLMAVNVNTKEVMEIADYGKKGVYTINCTNDVICIGGANGMGRFIPLS